MRRIPASYEKIWKTVARIPKGRVSTYGAIARVAGLGRHARLVGYALHALPEESGVPWHRVINARGTVSLRTGGSGAGRQWRLLKNEGIPVERGKVDLSRFGWPR